MQADFTDITVVLDRSGSMQSCRDDAEGGLNHFIAEQKKLPGRAVFTLVQFDHEYDFVHRAVPIADVPHCALVPRGNTALLDAVGRAIAETGARLKAMPEDQRPGLVVFVILTDGQENASREFTKHAVKEVIERQQSQYRWQFTYLGANSDAFADAGALGIPKQAAALYSTANARATMDSASSNVGRMRAATACKANVVNAYSADEHDRMTKP